MTYNKIKARVLAIHHKRAKFSLFILCFLMFISGVLRICYGNSMTAKVNGCIDLVSAVLLWQAFVYLYDRKDDL